MTALQ